MYSRFTRIILPICLILMVWADDIIACPDLVTNGSFESGTWAGNLTGWGISKGTPDLSSNGNIWSESNWKPLVEAAAHGTQWMCFGHWNGGEAIFQQLTTPLLSGQQYKVSYYAATINPWFDGRDKGRVQIRVGNSTPNNSHLPTLLFEKEVSGSTKQWHFFEEIITGGGWNFIEITLSTSHNVICVDDFSIVPIECNRPTCSTMAETAYLSAGQPFSTIVTGADADGDDLTFAVSGLPPGATITPSSGSTLPQPIDVQLDWTPGSDDVGKNYCVTFTFTDPLGFRRSCTVCLYVGACAKPPVGMVAWYGFDEQSGLVAKDRAGIINLGNLVGTPARIPGFGIDALRFDGVNDHVEVPDVTGSSSLRSVGAGDMSVDAWVRTSSIEPVVTLLDKRLSANRGWAVCLFYGRLGLIMADGTDTGEVKFISSGPGLNDGQWRHIAITLDRDSVTGLRFYVDGGETDRFDPTSVTGTMDSSQPLRIGASWPILTPQLFFDGDLDEVEIFDRVISLAEIGNVHAAGLQGKCKEACHVTLAETCCPNQGDGESQIDLTILNYSEAAEDYRFEIVDASGVFGCSPLDPGDFSPSNGDVTLLAGGEVTIPITVQCGTSGNICYRVRVSKLVNGTYVPVYTCDGRINVFPPGVFKPAWPNDDLVLSTVLDTTLVDFSFEDTDGAGGVIDYQVVAQPSDGDTSFHALSLDGLPPGQPVTGSLVIPPGSVAQGTVALNFSRHEPFRFYDIILMADFDGDGEMEAGATLGTASQVRLPDSTGHISGLLFDDANANGVQDSGEVGLEGRVVHLEGPIGELRLTGPTGEFQFDEVPPGIYSLAVEPEGGWSFTAPSSGDQSLTLTSGESQVVTFGTRAETGVVADCNCSRDFVDEMAAGPTDRWGHAMARDTLRGVTVVFGGYDGVDRRNDTWEWNGSSWTQVFPSTSPSPRNGQRMVYDSDRGVMVMYGGHDGTDWLGETWEYDGIDWTYVPSGDGTALYSVGLAYDPGRQVVVRYGGTGNGGRSKSTWEYAGGSWTLIDGDSAPWYRSGHRMVYDSGLGAVVMFGGQQPGSVESNDTWRYDGTWAQLSTTNAPSPRQGFGLTSNDNCGGIYLYGGHDGADLDGLWRFDGIDWQQVATSVSPGARNGLGLVFDSARDELVLFGGTNSQGKTWSHGCVNSVGTSIPQPVRRSLEHAVFPNPFNPATTIEYELPRAGKISLRVFDLRGRLVRQLTEGSKPVGKHAAVWRGDDHRGQPVSSGTYFYVLRFEDRTLRGKMTLLK